jgi:hypothetical protein
MHRLKYVLIIIWVTGFVGCKTVKKTNRVIFDVHLHGQKDPESQLKELEEAGVEYAAISTSWNLQNNYRGKTKMKLLFGLMVPCPGGKVPYSQQVCFDDGEEWPGAEWVRQQILDKKIDFIGEVLAQYHGISVSDTSMYPYYALAEKYDLPVGIHTGSAGPDHGSPNFKEEMGNPLLLKEALLKFPKMRVWLMHAGGPFLKEAIALMKEFPSVYADISAMNNPDILPAGQFQAFLKELIDAGLTERVMFGSDNAAIKAVISSVEKAGVLDEEQQRSIFFLNAKTFFKL